MAKANPIPMRADNVPRVGVVLCDIEHVLTLDEWRAIRNATDAAFTSLKVKCPTCRCRIYPGETCTCCAEPDIELPDPFDPGGRDVG